MRLADQFIAAAGSATDRMLGGALSALAADIARALSDDIRSFCANATRYEAK
jgi:hypothetical protein